MSNANYTKIQSNKQIEGKSKTIRSSDEKRKIVFLGKAGVGKLYYEI